MDVEQTSNLLQASDPQAAQHPLAQLSREELEAWLHLLLPRYRQVVVLRAGLDGAPPRSLQEIGRQLGVSKERIRQMENRAVEVIRSRGQRKPRRKSAVQAADQAKTREDPQKSAPTPIAQSGEKDFMPLKEIIARIRMRRATGR